MKMKIILELQGTARGEIKKPTLKIRVGKLL
jgi:hypothetical protein